MIGMSFMEREIEPMQKGGTIGAENEMA